MPIYRFRCPECLEEEENILPMVDRNVQRIHSCGATMERLMSLPAPAIFLLTSKDIAMKTLNKEDGYDFPTHKGDRPRLEKAMAKGLDQEQPTIGIGFG